MATVFAQRIGCAALLLSVAGLAGLPIGCSDGETIYVLGDPGAGPSGFVADVPGAGTGGEADHVGPLWLCVPCDDDESCRALGGDRCDSWDPEEGGFCLLDCDPSGRCPDGFFCADVGRPGGGPTRSRCIPDDGACDCSPVARTRRASTACGPPACRGRRACNDDGLGACDGHQTDEVCDGADNDCDGLTDEDLDGSPCPLQGGSTCVGTLRCVGGQATCEPAAPGPERCNRVDDDCDGETDEGFSQLGAPCDGADGDRCANGVVVCSADGRSTTCGPETVSHAFEVCNGADDDCDGVTDPEGAAGCRVYYADPDGDGRGSEPGRCLCAPEGTWRATELEGGCRPRGAEACNGVDDDCDGDTDGEGAVGCSDFYADSDGDGAAGGTPRCLCAPTRDHRATVATDCDDRDAAVGPGALERCGNGDDDCDGVTDPEGSAGCTSYYADGDFDGHGAGAPRCLCGPEPPYTSTTAGDCDDGDASVGGAGAEICNGADDDCDGAIDPEDSAGCTPYYRDADGDTYGRGAARCLCVPDGEYRATRAGDCDDARADVNPGAEEHCNERDDDCRGGVDDGGVCGDDPVRVCYPGPNDAWDVCYDLVPAFTVSDADYDYIATGLAASDPQYEPPRWLLDLHTTDASTKLARNFTLGEFMQTWKGRYAVYSPATVAHVQRIRTNVGVAVHINSGYRSPGYNGRIDGAATYSRHMYGDAADMHTNMAIAQTALGNACRAEAADFVKDDYNNALRHVHCDWRRDPLDEAFWAPY